MSFEPRASSLKLFKLNVESGIGSGLLEAHSSRLEAKKQQPGWLARL
jgi:hypothetical protein